MNTGEIKQLRARLKKAKGITCEYYLTVAGVIELLDNLVASHNALKPFAEAYQKADKLDGLTDYHHIPERSAWKIAAYIVEKSNSKEKPNSSNEEGKTK